MKTTWIAVAHRGGARLFASNGRGKGLNLVQDIPHPEGRHKNKDIGADKPGRSLDSSGRRHAFTNEQEPKHTSPNSSPNNSPNRSIAGASSIAIRSSFWWLNRVSSAIYAQRLLPKPPPS